MEITFGKHEGKSLEEVLLKHPDYVHWMLQQEDAYGAMKALQDEAYRLIENFDRKPFVEPCRGRDCTLTATRCTVYHEAVDNPYWWCDNCDPRQTGAGEGKIHSLSKYLEALEYVQLFEGGRVGAYKSIIKDMAKAKGSSSRFTEKRTKELFT